MDEEGDAFDPFADISSSDIPDGELEYPMMIWDTQMDDIVEVTEAYGNGAEHFMLQAMEAGRFRSRHKSARLKRRNTKG